MQVDNRNSICLAAVLIVNRMHRRDLKMPGCVGFESCINRCHVVDFLIVLVVGGNEGLCIFLLVKLAMMKEAGFSHEGYRLLKTYQVSKYTILQSSPPQLSFTV